MAGGFVCEAVGQALECALCAELFVPSQKRVTCCSQACGWKLGKAKSDAARSARVAAERQRVCKQCGADFSIKRLYGKPGEGQFCGRSCAADAARIYASKSEAKGAERARLRVRRGLVPMPIAGECERCGISYKPVARGQKWCGPDCARAAASIAKPTYLCLVCEVEYPCRSTGSRPLMTCGDECSVALRQAHRKAARAKRRQALSRGRIEVVHPVRVFKRDGWACRMCGTKTPEGLRGSTDSRAPELDHIVPLAEGGEHSYRNTQCLCRACNIAKGAGPGGQLLLFG